MWITVEGATDWNDQLNWFFRPKNLPYISIYPLKFFWPILFMFLVRKRLFSKGIFHMFIWGSARLGERSFRGASGRAKGLHPLVHLAVRTLLQMNFLYYGPSFACRLWWKEECSNHSLLWIWEDSVYCEHYHNNTCSRYAVQVSASIELCFRDFKQLNLPLQLTFRVF